MPVYAILREHRRHRTSKTVNLSPLELSIFFGISRESDCVRVSEVVLDISFVQYLEVASSIGWTQWFQVILGNNLDYGSVSCKSAIAFLLYKGGGWRYGNNCN